MKQQFTDHDIKILFPRLLRLVEDRWSKVEYNLRNPIYECHRDGYDVITIATNIGLKSFNVSTKDELYDVFTNEDGDYHHLRPLVPLRCFM